MSSKLLDRDLNENMISFALLYFIFMPKTPLTFICKISDRPISISTDGVVLQRHFNSAIIIILELHIW